MDFHENDIVSLYLSEMCELENITTDRQTIQLYLHPTLGKVLILNGEIQHIENYQIAYHEMLVHFPVSFSPNPQKVLIIGGGSLFAAYEILKYSSINEVYLCDYDPCVISLMKKHYPHARTVLSDRRFHYINQDAREFLDITTDKYDIIINDCFNVIKETVKNTPLSDLLLGMLVEDGISADIIYRYIFDQDTTIQTIKKMKTYTNVCFSLVTVPEYPGILHLEVIWGKNQKINQNTKISYNPEQLHKHKELFQYFNPYMLPYYLYLPPYIKFLFKE